MIKCKNCGLEVENGNFCPNCGSELSDLEVNVVENTIVDSKESENNVIDVEVGENISESTPNEEKVKEDIEVKQDSAVVVDEIKPASDHLDENFSSADDNDIHFCFNCGAEVGNAKFCSSCGFEVGVKENKNICPSCGSEVDDAKFCPKCGTSISNSNNYRKKTKYCTNCASQIDVNAVICPNCGVQISNVSEEKSALVAALLTILFPGLGHLYLGLNHKGLTFILLYVVSIILIIIIVGFVLMLVLWIWALVDVIDSTNTINDGGHVEDKLF